MSSDKLAKLKKLQAARKGKAETTNSTSDEEDFDRVYDEVDEKQYLDLKRKQLLQDDFIVDDDGVGYVDRGVEDDSIYYSDEYDNEDYSSNKKKKRKEPRKEEHQIGSLLRSQHTRKILASSNSIKPKKAIAVDEFDDILGEFDSDNMKDAQRNKLQVKLPSSPTAQAAQKRLLNQAAGSILKKPKIEMNSSPLKNQIANSKINDSLDDLLHDVEASPTMVKKTKEISQTETDINSSTTGVGKTARSDDEDSDDELIFKRRPLRSANVSRQVNFNSKSNPGTSPFVTAPGTPINQGLKNTSKKTLHYTLSEPLEFSFKYSKNQIIDPATDSFQMFWLDFVEINNSLILFGKVKANDGNLVSAMVQINELNRELFFLPREGHSAAEIHEEIIPLLMEKYGLANIRAKPQKMKYAFELPDIPHETEYLKVLLPFNCPKNSNDLIPPDLCSETFSHVFGGNSNIFESFVVQNKIMGPCWLEIKNGDFSSLKNASNCSSEVAVDIQNIKVIEKKAICNLKCVSLAVQTMMNPVENKQEIVSITLSTYKTISLESPIPEDIKADEVVTLVRPLEDSGFPVGFGSLAKQKLPGELRIFNNEKSLLSCFCAMMKVMDADVLIGHRLESVYLDVLVHRLYDLKVPTFSSLGRRTRKEWPNNFGRSQSSLNRFFTQELVAGRLVCDIGNEMGQSLTPKCQSWDLAEMYKVTCDKDHKSLDINFQNPQYRSEVNSMVMAFQENITNSFIAAEVSFRIQLLSLTKQLTNLAGNAWSQTLGGTRSLRNEYILLHEFARNGYVVPDKESRQARTQRMKKNSANDADDTAPSSKAKYQGGLVFDPEKGLHKNYVLVMDFNSLYPSIIQEFNICFTTVQRNLHDINEMPEVPGEDNVQGVLPRLLANLVARRREVKKIMKTEMDPHKLAQCDIRQQALKLTANSMYGCLGYVNSRFYAKPLAMLVTNKGREILMNTRQLAESMNLLVVYGDTDSVMIDTGCDSYADAIKIGQNFKRLVNERYKLLEIDIDNVFKRLLLHAKKKYAALNVSIDKAGNENTVLEVKGLDMKRREFCPLSKDVSTYVLSHLLSDKDPETALQEIYAYLEEIKSKVENNQIRADKYKINTKLSKDPSAYPGAKTMPAVQVALKMRKAGRVVKAGSVITFVITKQNDGANDGKKDGETMHFAERAYALNEVMIKSNNLVPDPDYYLEKQIFSPVERLLERIEGFDVVRLSNALGLESKKFLKRYNDDVTGNSINNLQPLETTISDVERFATSAILELSCPMCSKQFPFGGIVASNYYKMCFNGIQCKGCDHILSPIQLTAQLEATIRVHISLYYAGWLICDDLACGTVTRQMSVFGKRCLNEGCTGVMRYKYSDKQLYNQLLYFDSLFDIEKNKKEELKPIYHDGDMDFPNEALTESSIRALAEQNRELFEISRSVIQKYLSECGRRYVDMGGIFDFMSA
ncbi:hypothetical protein KAFR_0D01990 [Kazachstania africana CBS 2517]|uniref:DNA polymerase n=1 Tax=Kazachstania africana (strain ATCC 22294 / BCRC 22015 / CBS 2517 / CECT 1963 / NBRC 1671 / NRRL Y-8276) TaxID=1071382 RepID=H2ATZ6_KAZAF|nr:hypothetical protein KAFR_0D01990 [Kazachstania africana CBS 2517]CCF57846.1 hypothetical protein KAFR_0D01990 [Kazachstania africana CBS 2517]